MDAYRLVLSVVVLVLVAVAILLFEKKRATGIESDLKRMAKEQRKQGLSRDTKDDQAGDEGGTPQGRGGG